MADAFEVRNRMPKYDIVAASDKDGAVLKSGFKTIEEAWNWVHKNDVKAYITLKQEGLDD